MGLFAIVDSTGISFYNKNFLKENYIPLLIKRSGLFSLLFFSNDFNYIVFSPHESNTIVYSIKDKKEISIPGRTVAQSDDKRYFISPIGNEKGMYKIYDYFGFNHGLIRNINYSDHLYFFKTKSRFKLISGATVGKIHIYDINNMLSVTEPSSLSQPVNFLKDGNSISYLSEKEDKIFQIDLSGNELNRFNLKNRKKSSEEIYFKIDPDSKYLAFILSPIRFRDTVKIFLQKFSGVELKNFTISYNSIIPSSYEDKTMFRKYFTFSNDSKYFVTLSDSSTACIIRLNIQSDTINPSDVGQLLLYSVNDSDIVRQISDLRLKGIIRDFRDEERKEYEVE